MASIRKSHYVILPREDGSVAMHSMKEWLRQNPQYVTDGLDATLSTSQQLRACLRKQGWTLQETETEFRLLPPGSVAEAGSVLREMLQEPEQSDEIQEPEEAAFGLEYQLRDFLAQNLGAISVNGRKLRVYVDPAGRDGIEYPTAVGPIDLLGIADDGEFFVFELKRGRTPDHTIGQLMRYMGWVSQTIGKGQSVQGVIVAKNVSEALKYSICVVPKVSLFEYEVSFTLRKAGQVKV